MGKDSHQPGHDGMSPDRYASRADAAAHAEPARNAEGYDADAFDADAFDAALLAGIGSTTIGMTMTDPQGGFLWVNPAFTAISGYSASELRRMTVYDITHPDDVSRVRAETERLLAQATPDVAAASIAAANMVIEARYIARNGMWLWACVNTTLIRDAAGHPSRVVSIVEDLTPRVRSQRPRGARRRAGRAGARRIGGRDLPAV